MVEFSLLYVRLAWILFFLLDWRCHGNLISHHFTFSLLPPFRSLACGGHSDCPGSRGWLLKNCLVRSHVCSHSPVHSPVSCSCLSLKPVLPQARKPGTKPYHCENCCPLSARSGDHLLSCAPGQPGLAF